MRISCPYCGARGNEEFSYLGDADALSTRPNPATGDAARAFHEYVSIRTNPAGLHRELWYHAAGCRSWLIVTRNTVDHDITAVTLVREGAAGDA